MGLLTPLYLAGLAALSLPFVLHLIRRTPRGRQAFSSLMFLTPSPPRLTRRSRLDHLLLLVLRLTALALLAFAFARPFLRETAVLSLDEPPGRRVAIVLDASASMRRGDLWQQAVQKVEEVLADLAPADDVSLIVFDEQQRTLVGFSDEGDSRAGKADLVRRHLRALKPSWRGTRLGAALVAVAAELATQADVRETAAEPQLMVVSDFARGSKTEALQAYRWPDRVPVVLQTLALPAASNAGVQLLLDTEAPAAEPRVRVTNSAESTAEQLFVSWQQGEKRADDAGPLATWVPAGQSRVVRLPRPEAAASADRIVLRGDDADFDNVFYVVPPRPREMHVAWLADDDAVTAESARYFFELAVADDDLRRVEVRPARTADDLRLEAADKPEMIVTESPLTPPLAGALRRYAESGGIVVVLASEQVAGSMAELLDDVERAETATVNKDDAKPSYRMLGEIDFSHPLFSALANPRYNDFTKIHFWRNQALKLKSPSSTPAVGRSFGPSEPNDGLDRGPTTVSPPANASRVLARFDNAEPAILERLLGKGRVLVFTSGWQPDESQLALSSKFVPLIQALLDLAADGEQQAPVLTVGESLSLPKQPRKAAVIEKPDGKRVSLVDDALTFADTELPGIYRLDVDGQEHPFAVNVAAAESNTARMESETLEQLGVRLSSRLTRAQRAEQVRQQRDTELESRQHLWRWLVLEAIVLLILETLLAARAARKQEAGSASIPSAHVRGASL